MAATLNATPTQGKKGSPVVIDADGFLPDVTVSIRVQGPSGQDDTLEMTSDPLGSFSTTDEAQQAVATLTSSGVDVTANDTVTIGAVTYTFKAAPTTVANEVKVGGTAAASLTNLKAAINLTGTPGTDYGSLTVIHPTVAATTLTATTLKLVAKTGGTGGNALAFSKVAATLTVSAATFAGGAVATGIDPLILVLNSLGDWLFTASDGTSTATVTVRVFS